MARVIHRPSAAWNSPWPTSARTMSSPNDWVAKNSMATRITQPRTHGLMGCTRCHSPSAASGRPAPGAGRGDSAGAVAVLSGWWSGCACSGRTPAGSSGSCGAVTVRPDVPVREP
ncbi:hypothetical protein ACFFX0_17650 [Citricoccus parietis]|uniref:Uncharacterized protein n=1 Tax=Citricoccus parietis TaxID=592307 RepID=A0ABV5G1V9_9MICC